MLSDSPIDARGSQISLGLAQRSHGSSGSVAVELNGIAVRIAHIDGRESYAGPERTAQEGGALASRKAGMRSRPRAPRRLSPRFRRAPHDGLALDRGSLDGPLALLVLADALSDAHDRIQCTPGQRRLPPWRRSCAIGQGELEMIVAGTAIESPRRRKSVARGKILLELAPGTDAVDTHHRLGIADAHHPGHDADEDEARHEDEVKPRDEDAGAGDRPECPGASEPSRESLTRGQARDRYLGMARHRPEGGEGGVEHLGLDHAAAVRMAWGSQSRRSTVAQSTLRKNASM